MIPSSRRLLVLDDDPTGSQCVHDISVAFDQSPDRLTRSLSEPASTCFTLTNSRSLDEPETVALNRDTVRGVIRRLREDHGDEAASQLHVISRSDSTLRGHVIAEPNAIADVLEGAGLQVDAFLFCPAMIEAGRFTQDDVHYATVDGQPLKVENTDFARDATFGYSTSDLKEFLEERSHGSVVAEEVLSIGLSDIREGGRERVKEILTGAHSRRWVVVNALEYSDMETVADAVTEMESEGRHYITRCGPSFVRPLAGQTETRILTDTDITMDETRLDHGLVVVGSHVGLTTLQLEEVQRRGTLMGFELDVERLLDGDQRKAHLAETVEGIRSSLQTDDVAVYTSRRLISTDDPAQSLAIARSISDAVVEVVSRVRAAKPAWVVAKGGITSHEVAHKGLEIRLAQVAGQFFPGQISLFTPIDAPEETLGCPYVVFPGNVGGRQALADVVDRLKAATAQ